MNDLTEVPCACLASLPLRAVATTTTGLSAASRSSSKPTHFNCRRITTRLSPPAGLWKKPELNTTD